MRRIVFILLVLLVITMPVIAGGDKEVQAGDSEGGMRIVPRNRTLITSGWDLYSQVPAPNNFNPYLGNNTNQRNNLHYTIYEGLFYASLTSGEIEPWLGESYSYNSDYTVVTVKLRHDVVWSDGEAFTSKDVVFSSRMLIENAPELLYSGQFKAAVSKVEAPDDYTVVFTLAKANPRWARNELAYNLGQPTPFVIVPEHIWNDKNAKEFTNFDLEKGWPVGTGPYTLVYAGSDQLIFDLRDSWWADAAGKQSMPKVERIIYRPATMEAHANLYISNQLDIGRALQVGAFEAAKAQNPSLISWSPKGPVWGAPDGAVFRLTFNNQKPPFDDPDLHWAVNYALNRQQIVELAYENSTWTAVAPLSSYDGVEAYKKKLSAVFDKYDIGQQDLGKVAQIMTSKGYSKNADGFWQDSSGKVLQLDVQAKSADPSGPVVVQQLRNAGFDAKLDVVQYASLTENARSGNFDLHLYMHAGSAYDPYLTLEHYHSNYSVPEGKLVSSVRAYTRYSNPEMDTILDKMAGMVPSADDPEYVELAGRALDIYFRDLPDITLAEELHVITMNTEYWKGWPSIDDPYMHPYICWVGFGRIIHNLEPTQ